MKMDDKVITIDGKEYLVVETVKFNEREFAYLVNNDNVLDSMFKEIVFSNGMKVVSIDKKLFSEEIYPLFLKKIKKY